jgi:rsbT co-antagonist protein RsbR
MIASHSAESARLSAEIERLRVVVTTLEQLLAVHEQTALMQAEKLEHALADLETQAAERARLQDELIQTQAATLHELSTPLIPLADGVVALPLIGNIDSRRAQRVIEVLLDGIVAHRATTAIVDITGVQVVDTEVANALVRAAQAVSMLGARVILTGIRPEVAQTLVSLGTHLQGITTRSTLQSGVAAALSQRTEG